MPVGDAALSNLVANSAGRVAAEAVNAGGFYTASGSWVNPDQAHGGARYEDDDDDDDDARNGFGLFD